MACESCKEQIKGVCKDFLNSDCIYVSEDLQYTGIKANTVLTSALKRIDEVINQIKNGTSTVLSLINIGTGAKIYSGINSLGDRQLRTLISSDSSVEITELDDEIDFKVTVETPEITQATTTQAGIVELATQAEVNAGTDSSRAITPSTLKVFVDENENEYSIQITDNTLNLLKNGTIESTQNLPTTDDTYVTGFDLNGSEITITLSDTTEYSIDISNLLEFEQVQADFTMEDSSQPSYIKNKNPNKTVFANYTLQASDNNYVIVIDSNSPVTITVPNSLPDKFFVGFIQKGTGLVTIANVDIIPEGMTNTLKGRGHQGAVEKIEGTKFLFGNLNKSI